MKHLLLAFGALMVFAPGFAYAAPVISNGSPVGVLPADVGSVTLKVDTDVLAHCKYASTPGVAYASMVAFTTGTSTTHLVSLTVQNDTRYDLYIKCQDVDGSITATEYNVYFGVARGTPPDTAPPVISEVNPSGVYAGGTAALTFTLRTDENATCRYGTSSAAYASLPYIFAVTGGNVHQTPLSGLKDGTSYSYYARCEDGSKNANGTDQVVAFSVATSTASVTAPPVTATAPSAPSVPAPQKTAAPVALKFAKDLRYGTKDIWVLLLQLYLALDGRYKGPYDSVFGDQTLAAVKAFQASRGLPATGFVGPLTRAQLDLLLK